MTLAVRLGRIHDFAVIELVAVVTNLACDSSPSGFHPGRCLALGKSSNYREASMIVYFETVRGVTFAVVLNER